jgi:hypothetical protein
MSDFEKLKLEKKVFKALMSRIKVSSRETKIHGLNSYSRGRKKELEVNINWEDLKNQYHKQNGKCYWLNITLNLSNNLISWHPLACSCDRLNNEIGYTKDNIVISSRFANLGRGAANQDLFRSSLNEILENFKSSII